ncbi:hypothetical protein [Bdellovibrio sp. HCB2-146]|uniref:hypothetical protein n=1 Tax=Bdellovibrio sp. HCB2-146 TaxID=3394362 RepID=UPI0039BC6953
MKIKSVFLVTALLLSVSSANAARFSYFEDVNPEFCPSATIDYKNDAVFCKSSDTATVLNAKVGSALSEAELKNLNPTLWSVSDANIVPDDSSSTIYWYVRWLVNDQGTKVGILTIEGWANSEMRSRAQFKTRYNLKGQAVVVVSKDLY